MLPSSRTHPRKAVGSVPFTILDLSVPGLHNVIIYEYAVHEVFMRKASLITVRVPEELAARLANLSKATDRSRSYLATLAIEEFVAVQEWQVEAIKEGIADAEKGRVVSHEEAAAELGKWGKK
jgi:predicted transcriptional regulator